jgi:hypothetical protein
MKWVSKLGIVAFAVCVVAGSGTAVAKSPHPGRPAPQGEGKVPSAVQRPEHTSTIPRRYTVVNSGSLGAPNGSQTHGAKVCPAHTVVWGGGVFVSSGQLGANVNSSYPAHNGWAADVNNAGGSDTTFVVYAICAKQPRTGYSIRSATVTNIAGHQTSASVTCPGTTKILGGGGYSNSGSTAVNINSTFPFSKNTWRVDMNNASGSDAMATAYAVCGKAKGRTNVVGIAVPNPAGQQTHSAVSCPLPKVPSGGGQMSSSANTAVNLNGTSPTSNGWESWENNGSGVNTSTTSYVVCVGT